MSSDTSQGDNWLKWLIGSLVSLLAAGGGIVALLSYLHPPPSQTLTPSQTVTPRQTVTPVTPSQTVTGEWNYIMRSHVSGKTYQGLMRLTQDGAAISGEMDAPGGGPGATSAVTGTYVQGKLKLSRNAGMNTAQEYRLDGTGQQLTGAFSNVGAFPDSGSIEIRR